MGFFPSDMPADEIYRQVQEVAAMGDVQYVIHDRVHPGQVLHTPTRQSPFTVKAIDSRGVVLLLGRKRAVTRFSWECLEGVVPFLRQHGGQVEIGGRYDTAPHRGTLDEYLKRFVNRATAGWVAALLEEAGIVEITRERPALVGLPD